MKKTENNLITVSCVFVVALVISNVLTSKVVQIGPLIVPAAIIAYPLTYLMTDIIGEIWGKAPANRIVLIGILCQIIALIMITIAIYMPTSPEMSAFNQEYRDVLGSTGRVVLASLVSFVFSQTWDVFAFHKLKDIYEDKKWLRNNAATCMAQVIDSTLFVTIAFAGSNYDILVMIGSQIVVKWILALCDTPFFYLLTKKESDTVAQ